MKWIPVDETLPESNVIVQSRVQGPYDEKPRTRLGYRAFPRISSARVPISEVPHVWYSLLDVDHKGRHDELLHVTHWAPLLDPELSTDPCKCAEIQQHDRRRHFQGCPLRKPID